jgi:hypothetical protein
MFNNKMIFVIVTIVVTILLIYNITKEGFNPDYTTAKWNNVKNIHYNSTDPSILSNGTVQKYRLNDDLYSYEYLYNLPNVFSSLHTVRLTRPFNVKRDDEEYRVFAGKSKDNMEFIGNLKRSSDGYQKLYIETKKNYSVTCILIRDKIIHCSDL